MAIQQIERVIPLNEAAGDVNISVETLTRLISDGMMKAVRLPDGSMAVSESDARRVAQQVAINEQLKGISRDQFAKLCGRPITISRASEHYRIPGTTIRDWVKRGYVRSLDPGSYPVELDQADIAYCAAIHRVRSAFGVLRVPLLNEQGLPYQLKRPALSAYRRRKKGKQIPVAAGNGAT